MLAGGQVLDGEWCCDGEQVMDDSLQLLAHSGVSTC
jgi:hypothetical protein